MKSVNMLLQENPNMQVAEWDRFRRKDGKRESDDRASIVAYIRDWASTAEEESDKETKAGCRDDAVGFRTSAYVLYDLADAIENRKDLL